MPRAKRAATEAEPIRIASARGAGKTVAEIVSASESELLADWLENIRALLGSRALELMSEVQLQSQARDLLRALATAFASENYTDVDTPQFADVVALLRDISSSRAQQGFTPSETATFVMSLRDALLGLLQEEYGGDPGRLNAEITRISKVIDKLALVTFETFVQTREEVITEQSSSLMDLSTPVVSLWDGVVMVPLVGVIDTPRAQQMLEKLLEAIVATESRVAILDITGVPVMDTSVARHLLRTVSAAKMLGTEVVITGLSAAVAQTLVALGIELATVTTRGTLRAGVTEALRLVGKRVVPAAGEN